MNNPYTVLIVLAGIVVLWLVMTFNRLITLRNRVHEAASDIEVQTKRRWDLIPNLVQTVKGYMTHESAVFEKVTEARTRAMGAGEGKEKAQAENMLSGTLKSLFAVAENYPDLKANENFNKLHDQLAETEDKIQAARRFYNGNVRDFNTKIETFPTNMIAGMFGFKKAEFFDAPDSEAEVVSVKF